ncbi:DUF397 domain-containing protein [Streptomyces mayteni]
MRATPELSAAEWRKSSYSNPDGGNCLEIADGFAAIVPVRDSKAAPAGPSLLFPTPAWNAFVRSRRCVTRANLY